MTKMPTTRRERREADLERKAERMQRDERFQRLRTRGVRRILVIAGGLLVLLIIPAFAAVGSIAGIVVTAAAWGCWWLLRVSVRTVADLPDRFLDERQRAMRNRGYFSAYLILGWIVAGLLTVALVGFVLVSENDAVTLTTTWDQALGLVLSLTLLISLLPSMTLAWRDAGESTV